MQKLLLLSVLLLSFSWAAAQDTPSQTTPNQDQTQSQPAPDRQAPPDAAQTNSGGQNNMGGQMTVKGCLSSSNGNYMLTDKNGTMYQLSGDTSKLSDHVGHEVRVTGTMGAAGGSQAGDTSSMGTSGGSAQQTLQVASIKHISKTCQNGGGMSH